MNNNTIHNYEYEVDLNGGSAPARVINMVGNNKNVLEIGAGPGSITKHLQATGNCKVVALEIDDDAITRLRPFCEQVYKADLNDATWPSLLGDRRFDVVVAADVLEHVYDPWSTLKLMAGLLNDDGSIVISLPHVGHSVIAACLIDEDFGYRDWGLLDRTHIRFFGLKNMQSLFNNAGLDIEDAQFVIVKPEASEFVETWSSISSEARKVLSSYDRGNIYQVVVKAVPSSRSNRNLDLMKLPVQLDEAVESSVLKGFIKKITPVRYRSKVRRIAHKLGIKG